MPASDMGRARRAAPGIRAERCALLPPSRFYSKVQALHQEAGASVVNPLLAYALIKRLQSDWLNVVNSMEASENMQELKKDYRQVEKDLPVFEDLEGAARALMRLQDVYALSVKGLVKGVFRRDGASGLADLYHPGQRFSLSADDCFHIGKVRTSALAPGWLSPNLATAVPGMEIAWLKGTVDPVIVSLDRRIAAVTGLDIRPPYAEYLQVVNYGIGGQYEPHFDHATSRKSPLYRMKSGNRIATIMIYLSSVEAGGATAFIYANFSVPVIKNAALFWWNLHRNGDGNGDTLHAGCPVLAGDKWVANKWIHEHGQEFRRPCGAHPED
ncbi:PREDICTED: prolyl 4-hydroxylase subunit alpha-3 [Crocodylus porosus]|uniref:prolyl 4-hydroxylase subunit alpha-3 n=1 Tax=Crocodylus porosus TaxID=8502 RepID=UPI0009405826|nr:PREDICTED: prolyl 4-hydroxylase subunit alpha-3 [Crocodylus porosus]